ncbi:SRPBCC family protein [Actinoplanes sp. NPDC049265]|uniref:SRPBCC family protein n=1 Tax=Actinoplanes sp. NPDC049265 TaxID=3363902 RepID=UPI00370FAD95
MLVYTASTEIDATTEQVWDVLTDFSSYPAWSAFITGVGDTVVVGEPIQITLVTRGGRSSTFTPRLIALERGRRFAWSGHLLHPAIFTGVHELVLEPVSADRTRLIHRETLTGPLPYLMYPLLKMNSSSYRDYNAALKQRVESSDEPAKS